MGVNGVAKVDAMFPYRIIGRSKYQPYVTFFLVVANVLVFLFELVMISRGHLSTIFWEWGYNPCSLGTDPLGEVLLDAVRSMFLHGGWAHLAGNMLFLWLFGGRVEQYFGRVRYLLFYLGSGFGATLAFQLTSSACTPAIGASGAISGILGAFWLLYPGVRVKTIVLIKSFKIPALYMLAYWFIIQLFYGILALGPGGSAFGSVAYWAHIGGFITGLILVFFTMMIKPPPPVDPLEHLNDD